MDLGKILASVDGKEDLIRQIEVELGKEYVPRTEFNAKNTELKDVQKQLGEMTTGFDGLTKEKASWDATVAELNGKVKSHETASLKARIALESGIPYELAGRLAGEDEKTIRADADSLSKLIKKETPLPPLRSTEPAGESKDAAYKALLTDIKGE